MVYYRCDRRSEIEEEKGLDDQSATLCGLQFISVIKMPAQLGIFFVVVFTAKSVVYK